MLHRALVLACGIINLGLYGALLLFEVRHLMPHALGVAVVLLAVLWMLAMLTLVAACIGRGDTSSMEEECEGSTGSVEEGGSTGSITSTDSETPLLMNTAIREYF